MVFEGVQQGPPDIMYYLKMDADGDNDPNKTDLGVGVYRNENGTYHELAVLKEAKGYIAANNPDHDYEVTTGNEEFLQHAAEVVFGDNAEVLKSERVASVQTISGTGAVHLGAMFLSHSVPNMSQAVHVGTPTWGNYGPLFKLTGMEVKTYTRYNVQRGEIDFASVERAVEAAPPGSCFVLQACCHNPTAADFSREQWKVLATRMKARGHFPFFDIAYQGLGHGVEEDLYGVRLFVEYGFEMLVCQSFSKNFGLYGERVGALHVVCSDGRAASAVHDQLRCLIRWEFSSSPAYGARLVNYVLSDADRKTRWKEELAAIRERLRKNRAELFRLLNDVYKTPGDWNVIRRGTGLFSFLPLTPAQCDALVKQNHIYLVPNGRINISGLSERNIDHVARSIDAIVRSSQAPRSSL